MDYELINLNARKNTFEVETEIQGKTVKGEFTVHFPSIADKIQIETKLASILNGVDLANMQLEAYNIARACCYLQQVLDKKPDWFDAKYLDDGNVVLEVYVKAKEFEASFRQETKQPGSKEDSESTEDKATLESK